MPPLLSIRNLSTVFAMRDGVRRAVNQVDLDVNVGETVAIVGESGSGKSVLALSILRLLPSPPAEIVSGRIMFDGTDLLTVDEAQLRKVRGAQIGFVFQEPMTALNPVLTVGRQITEQLEEHLGLTGRAAHRRACELLELVEMPEPERRLRSYPHQFSGGMRQRAMIAIALSCGPRLLIADEPTTALDVTTQAAVLDLIQGIARKSGIAVLLITHDLGVVARYADRVSVMYAGRVVEQAAADVLFANPLHPYTQGLLASVPRVDRTGSGIHPIRGNPPDASRLPTGCAFRERCDKAISECATQMPVIEVHDGSAVACWVASNEHQLA